jgi:tRNA (guanine37-N1)-methyltransferase
MRFTILSLFPEYFQGPFDVSILKRAREKGLVDIQLVNIRDFSQSRHKKVDDKPFGGGPGMVLSPDPVVSAIKQVKKPTSKVVYLSPQGKPLTNQVCQSLAKEEDLILLCGHYEGIDERVLLKYVDIEISIGDYVLTNGCAAAIVLVDSVIRFIPEVIGHPEAVQNDSFQHGFFDAPHYTRPQEFEGMSVPEVLLNGHHAQIEEWRKKQGLEKTKRVRPDLYDQYLRTQSYK